MLGYRAPSKKAIKDAIKAHEQSTETPQQARLIDFEDRMQETSLFGAEYHGDGTYVVVGPDAYTDRRWYGTLTVVDGIVVKVK